MSSKLYSLGNNKTAKLDLYVMQNAHGLIKIGRSSTPTRRRLQLEQQTHCPIEIISVLPAFGHHEERVHLLLSQFSLGGEWFSGSQEAKDAINAALNTTLTWLYPLDAQAAELWLEKQIDAASERYWRKRARVVVANLKGALLGHRRYSKQIDFRHLDARIAGVFGLNGGATMYEVCDFDGDSATGWYRMSNGTLVSIEIPRFTQSMDEAVKLWLPEDIRIPRRQVKDALDCCFAALCDRWTIDEATVKQRDTW